jgi:hypothetical protein
MKLLAQFITTTFLISGSLWAQDIVGRWVGVASTTDEAGTKRQERQTLEIKSEDGKLSGLMVTRTGPGFPLQVQQDGARFNFYSFLVPKGGEHLRWKFELKDGSLVGTFSAQHDNPTQWKYDRVGAMTVTKEDPSAAAK